MAKTSRNGALRTGAVDRLTRSHTRNSDRVGFKVAGWKGNKAIILHPLVAGGWATRGRSSPDLDRRGTKGGKGRGQRVASRSCSGGGRPANGRKASVNGGARNGERGGTLPTVRQSPLAVLLATSQATAACTKSRLSEASWARGRAGGREGGRTGDGEGCRCAAGGRFRGLTRAAGAMSALPSALRLTCCRSWLLLICLVFLVSGCSCDTRPDRLTRELLAGDDVRGSSYDDDDADDDVYDDRDYLEENITAGECCADPVDHEMDTGSAETEEAWTPMDAVDRTPGETNGDNGGRRIRVSCEYIGTRGVVQLGGRGGASGTEEVCTKGQYLGSPCDVSCNPELQHVFCDTVTGFCVCEKFYPVRLGPSKGCAKPKRLGEQCFYRATCTFADQHSTCIQVQHNAVCDCEEGYHRVALSRPSKKVFCAEGTPCQLIVSLFETPLKSNRIPTDRVQAGLYQRLYTLRVPEHRTEALHRNLLADLGLITTNIPTLLCIASGIAVFTAMICFVLKLFSRARYSRPRHYANANHAPPMLFSSNTGIPLTLHGGRPSSRSSQRSSTGGPLSYAFSRRPSSGGSRGPLVSSSRAGSRRPSLTSVHSSTSSGRSYSVRRLEKERNEKEQRQALQELRLAKQREQQQQQQQQQPTPSPRTPHSMDELLPSVEEGKEVFYNEVFYNDKTRFEKDSVCRPFLHRFDDSIESARRQWSPDSLRKCPFSSSLSHARRWMMVGRIDESVPTTSDITEETPMKTTAITTTNVNATRFGEMAPVTTSTTSIFETNIAPRATGDIFQVSMPDTWTQVQVYEAVPEYRGGTCCIFKASEVSREFWSSSEKFLVRNGCKIQMTSPK
ncbi:hypothetical protein WN48_03057 [Eufriesea mexicana]|uniref:EB domain-containing protein n=1 Tax=Eufriesea mexicana TaxID=516756 RepID=A0A310S4H0_9HYME|nr:hypothetical protein WN48_03057 [Eufriesea mexicana]